MFVIKIIKTIPDYSNSELFKHALRFAMNLMYILNDAIQAAEKFKRLYKV